MVTFLASPMVASMILAISALLVARVVLRARRQRIVTAKRGCKEPFRLVPVRDPIIGLDFIWDVLTGRNGDEYIRDAAADFARWGKTYVVRRWSWTTINTADPRNIQHMLATGFNDFQLPFLRVTAMAPLFGRGIFTLDGAPWRHARALLKPSFTRANMTPLIGMMENHIQALLQRIPAGDGGEVAAATVDLQPFFFWFTMDTATDFLIGKSTGMLDLEGQDGEAQSFVDDYVICCVESVYQMQIGPLGLLRHNFSAHRAKKRICAYIDSFVDDAVEELAAEAAAKHDASGDASDDKIDEGAEYNFVRELARATDDRKTIRDQILHVLLAGRDTTASLLSNLFFMLARHPVVYQKLRHEVLEKTSGKIPTEQDLRNMEYLRWCVSESLRLHPVVPTNARDAACDTYLPHGGGPDGESPIFVAKGTPIMYSVYAMHRDESIYGERADEFVPERWEHIRPMWGHLPFNGGPRICIGQQFALTEAWYVTARLVQTFETVEPRDDRPWTELYTLAMCSRNGVKVAVKRAANDSTSA